MFAVKGALRHGQEDASAPRVLPGAVAIDTRAIEATRDPGELK